jgi:hypothetical protein
MNDEQRFFFDLKGWLMLPSVLGAEQCTAVREHLLAGGSPFTGPAQELLDHPVVADVLTEILADRPVPGESHAFRCENSFVTIRQKGWATDTTNRPHVVLPARRGGPMSYQCRNGRIYSGLTRVVWELNPVRRGMGGTLFLSGTHKADFAFPPGVLEVDNAHLESYECPAGSVFIFTESLLHASTEWKDPEIDRVSIFSAYNSVWAQWHRTNLAHEIVAGMPPKRQSLFRGVYAIDFEKTNPTAGANHHYSLANRAL